MQGLTHAAVGAAVAMQVTDSIPLTGVIVIGSLLPDIDKGNSLLGRYNPLSFVIPHRTITHCLLFLRLGYLISLYLSIGILTHYILDMLNPDGIPLFWPVPFDMHIPVIGRLTSGGTVDWIILISTVGYMVYTITMNTGGTAWV